MQPPPPEPPAPRPKGSVAGGGPFERGIARTVRELGVFVMLAKDARVPDPGRGEVVVSGGSYLFSRAAWERSGVRYDSMTISTASRKNLRDTGAPIVEVGIRARIGVAEQRKILDLRTILRTLASAARLGVEK